MKIHQNRLAIARKSLAFQHERLRAHEAAGREALVLDANEEIAKLENIILKLEAYIAEEDAVAPQSNEVTP